MSKIEEMGADDIRQRLKEIEKDFQSEDFFDDLQHPAEVVEGLIALLGRALALLHTANQTGE